MQNLLGKSSSSRKFPGIRQLPQGSTERWAGPEPLAVCSGRKRESPQHPFSLREMQWCRKPKNDDEIQSGKGRKKTRKRHEHGESKLPQAAKENSLLTPNFLWIETCGARSRRVAVSGRRKERNSGKAKWTWSQKREELWAPGGVCWSRQCMAIGTPPLHIKFYWR